MLPIGHLEPFWSTVAQVAIVLALTVIVEARFLVRSWKADVPVAVRLSQAIVLAVVLVAIWFTVALTLAVLASRRYDPWMLTLSVWAVGGALGLTLLAPMLDVLRAAAAPLTVALKHRLETRKTNKALTVLHDVVAEGAERTEASLTTLRQVRNEAREALRIAREHKEPVAEITAHEATVDTLNRAVRSQKKEAKTARDRVGEADDLAARVRDSAASDNAAGVQAIVEKAAGPTA